MPENFDSLIPANSFTGGPNVGLTNPFKGSGDTGGGYMDRYLDDFAKSNLQFESNPLMAFQDPTYLGFKLMFLFDQADSGLLSTVPHPNTAVAFLERIGDTERAYFMRQFVNTLRDINTQCPWYWQEVSGLDDTWKRGFQESEYKAKEVKKLTIGCLESIDLRVTSLVDLYRKACYDWDFKRELVPWNLRTFTMYMYVYDGRNIRVSKAQEGLTRRLFGGVSEDPGNDVRRVNRMMFKFEECEILPDESGEYLSKVSNVIKDQASQKLVIRYRHVHEENVYHLYSDKYVADKVIKLLDKAALDDPSTIGAVPSTEEERRKTFLQNLESVYDLDKIGDAAQAQAAARARGLISGAVGGVLLGNIYGISAVGLATAAEGGLVGAAQQVIRTGQGAGSSVNNDTSSDAGGKYFDNVTPNPGGAPAGNVMAESFGPESDGNPGTSLVNSTEGPIGTLPGGVSLGNVNGHPDSSVGGGHSILNVSGQAAGSVEQGESTSNVNEEATGDTGGGESTHNVNETATGQVGGGQSLVNGVAGVATGQVGGGQSLVNGLDSDATGQVGGGESLGNSSEGGLPNAYSGSQPSRANVDGAASGAVGGGQSLANAANEAPAGTVGGGPSTGNDPAPAEGTVGGGPSLGNVSEDPTGQVGGGPSTQGPGPEPATGEVGGGGSVLNGQALPAGGQVGGGQSLANTNEPAGGLISGGESLANGTGEPDGNVYSGPQESRPMSDDPATGTVGGGSSLDNAATRPPDVPVGGGASVRNAESERLLGRTGEGSPSSKNEDGEATDNVYNPK